MAKYCVSRPASQDRWSEVFKGAQGDGSFGEYYQKTQSEMSQNGRREYWNGYYWSATATPKLYSSAGRALATVRRKCGDIPGMEAVEYDPNP